MRDARTKPAGETALREREPGFDPAVGGLQDRMGARAACGRVGSGVEGACGVRAPSSQ